MPDFRLNLYLWDAVDGTTRQANLLADGTRIDSPSNAALSADGRFLAFDDQLNSYLYDATLGHATLMLASSIKPILTGDGRFVVFESSARLVNNDTNSSSDIYLLDRSSNIVSLISGNLSGTANGDGRSFAPQISSDGRFVLFASHASNLTATETNGFTDIFLRDLPQGVTLLISDNQSRVSGNSMSANPIMSADGGTIVFESFASDLAIGDLNHARDIFTVHVPLGDSDGDGLPDDWEVAYFGDLSADGRDDPDRDGASNRDEFIAGTNPTNSSSILKIVTIAALDGGRPVRLLWSTVPGKNYELQFKDDLSETGWRVLSAAATATSTQASAIDDVSRPSNHRFYRAVLVP